MTLETAISNLVLDLERRPCCADIPKEGLPLDRAFASTWPEMVGRLCGDRKRNRYALACLLIGEANGLLNQHELLRLIYLEIQFGMYQNALDLCELVESAYLDLTERKRILRLRAKAFRHLGDYAKSRETLEELLMMDQDPLWCARIMCDLAKVSHNHGFRVGYCAALLKASIGFLDDHDDPTQRKTRWRSVCLDALADVELDRAFANFELQGEDPEVLRALGDETETGINHLEEAIQLSQAAGSLGSLQRQRMRLCYYSFLRTQDSESRRTRLREYLGYLKQMDMVNDPMARGVRLGQYGEMLAHLGDFDGANREFAGALKSARWVSDWRTVTKNHLRAATMALELKEHRYTFEQHIQSAEEALKLLRGQHPELELQIQDLRVRYHLKQRGYTEALAAIRRKVEVLQRLEARVLNDFRDHQLPESDFCPAERRILGKEVWSQLGSALVFDYQVVSSHLKQAISTMSGLALLEAKAEAKNLQIQMLMDYQESMLHRFKNLLQIHSDQILGSLRRLATTRGDHTELQAVDFVEAQLGQLDQWRKETERDLKSLPGREPNWVSMRSVAAALRPWEAELPGSELQLQIPSVGKGPDFELWTLEPLLRRHLTSLVENAARMAELHAHSGQVVAIEVDVEPTEGLTGVLKVVDTAGKWEELKFNLERIYRREGGVMGGSGLYLAVQYFRTFGGRLTAEPRDGGRTCLRIVIPRGSRIRFAGGEA